MALDSDGELWVIGTKMENPIKEIFNFDFGMEPVKIMHKTSALKDIGSHFECQDGDKIGIDRVDFRHSMEHAMAVYATITRANGDVNRIIALLNNPDDKSCSVASSEEITFTFTQLDNQNVFYFDNSFWTIGESRDEVPESALKLKIKMRLHVTDMSDLTAELMDGLSKEFKVGLE